MKEQKLPDIKGFKNDLIDRQTRRIRLLEEKLAELRHKYFRLKYDDEKIESHLLQTRKY